MNGFFNVLKPTGLTASDVVVRMRKILGERHIGHLGTLDPGASGVLPLAVGRATKLFNLLTYKKKSYRAFFTFGTTTDTLDSYGEVTQTKPANISFGQLQDILKQFVGKIMQRPPSYSSIFVEGTRSYSLARAGKEVELPQREVEVFDMQLIRQVDENTFVFDITCGGGTYIRSLVRDIAFALNTVGFLSALIRTSSGLFLLDDAVTFEEVTAKRENILLDISYPLADFDEHIFDAKYYKPLINGVKLSIKRFEGTRRIVCCDNLIGMGHCDETNRLIIDVFLTGENGLS